MNEPTGPNPDRNPRPRFPVRLHSLAPFADLSGAPISALAHAELLQSDFAEVCLGLPAPGPIEARARAAGVPVRIWKVENRGLRKQFFRRGLHRDLGAVIRSRQDYYQSLCSSLNEIPGIVHVHSSLSIAPLALLAARRCRAPAVLHLRETARTAGDRLRMGALALLADATVCVSAAVRRAGGFWLGRRSRIIHNFFNLPPPAAGEKRQIPRLGLVGRMTWAKGPDLFLKMCAELLRAGMEVEAWLVGGWREPQERRQTVELMAALKLSERVQIRDLIPDPDSLYRQLDVLVLPTRRDSFPRVVMEAMGYGLPVVATRIDGVPEMVQDGVTGFLVAPEDVAGFTAATARLLRDPALRRQMGAAGRVRAEQIFSPEVYLTAMRQLYQDLGAGK